jgi:hypothetical protein
MQLVVDPQLMSLQLGLTLTITRWCRDRTSSILMLSWWEVDSPKLPAISRHLILLPISTIIKQCRCQGEPTIHSKCWCKEAARLPNKFPIPRTLTKDKILWKLVVLTLLARMVPQRHLTETRRSTSPKSTTWPLWSCSICNPSRISRSKTATLWPLILRRRGQLPQSSRIGTTLTHEAVALTLISLPT